VVSVARTTPNSGLRPEIQGLRALAVLAVVLYHLWPNRLGGGFVGVDVFFAISGFLITAHLLREVRSTGRLSLSRFWARRVRRLLPASLLVLVAVGVAVTLWVPSALWAQMFQEIGASALYAENWQLAANTVDYLARDNHPSPVQHFWSLSAEEQFYIAWPILIIVSLFIARRLRRINRRFVIGVVLATITFTSLAWSIWDTRYSPASAYFVTTTRAWEFGAGGLLAYFAPEVLGGKVAIRTIVSWLGWALMVVTMFTYSGLTPFPGFAAAAPVVGALAVIWAGSENLTYTPSFLAKIRPVQFVGDISYSLYLWHWPLIVIVPLALREQLTAPTKIVILLAAVLLAWGSKVWVEDPIRAGHLAAARPWRTFATVGLGMAVVVAGAGVGLNALNLVASADQAAVQRLIDAKTPCFGAAAIDPANQPCVNPALKDTVLPSLTSSLRDISPTWTTCQTNQPVATECVLGVKGGTRVALVGDSHAHEWLTAIQAIAKTQNWEVHMIVHGSCPFSHVQWMGSSGQVDPECDDWNAAVDKKLASEAPYSYLITSMRAQTRQTIVGSTPVAQATLTGFQASWQPLIDRGTTIVGIHDPPNSSDRPKGCIIANPHNLAVCTKAQSVALGSEDYLADAAQQTDGAVEVDMSEYFCAKQKCPDVIGGVLVNRDDHHLTETYATSLAPYLDRAIAAAVAKGKSDIVN
jgi:peptidoglycan/LPS O-acetylase OafA/YrhL